MLTKNEISDLIKVSHEARQNAFAFKSNHNFGAAILTDDGQLFTGCNIDGVISSQGICAEMCAINHAVIHGKYSFKAICVADKNITYPCGACLQYLNQFGQVNDCDFEIIASDSDGNYEIKKLSDLLPNRFFSETFDAKMKEFNK